MKEKTIRTERIYNGKIINLRVDEVVLPNGKKTTREIMEHPGAVAIVPLLSDKRVVLIEQFRKAVEEIILEIPAGKLEKRESPLSCAKRELVEETGYQAGKFKKIISYYPSPGFTTEIIHIFVATNLKRQYKKMNLDEDEFLKVKIVRLDKAIEYIEQGKIKDSKTIIGLLLTAKILNS